MNAKIRESIDFEFAKRGYTKTDVDLADVHIEYQATSGTDIRFTPCNAGWGYVSGWYFSMSFGDRAGGVTTGTTSRIYKGQLALDIYDQHHDLVWCGIVNKAFNTNAKPANQQRKLQRAVFKLLRNYPPPKK